MSQKQLCKLGKQQKVLSYVKDNNYIHSICKLKDEITEEELNEFFTTIYNQELIQSFNLILLENNCINLKDICFLINNNNEDTIKLLTITRNFLDMFEIIKEDQISLNNHDAIKSCTNNANKKFYQEVESIFYNSKVLDYIYCIKTKKLTKQS